MINDIQQEEYARRLTGTYTIDGHSTKIEAWYEQTQKSWQAVFKHDGELESRRTCELPEKFGNTLEELVRQHILFTLKHSAAEIVFNPAK